MVIARKSKNTYQYKKEIASYSFWLLSSFMLLPETLSREKGHNRYRLGAIPVWTAPFKMEQERGNDRENQLVLIIRRR